MNQDAGKFFPQPRPESRAWWESCREGKLLIQQCRGCGHYQFYPRIVCTRCMGDDLNWVQSSGQATVRSFTICRRPVSAAYAADVPYVIALVQLEEGPTMMCNILQCDPESVATGMPVEVIFEKWSDEISVPQFRPAAE